MPNTSPPVVALARGIASYETVDCAGPKLLSQTIMRLVAAVLGVPPDDPNPLCHLVKQGGTVVIKPNLVLHETGELIGKRCLTTDFRIVESLVEMALEAVGRAGRVVICDTPLQSADFIATCQQNGLFGLVRRLRDEDRGQLELVDLRVMQTTEDDNGYVGHRKRLPGDPRGASVVDLAEVSALEDISVHADRFRIENFPAAQMRKHQRPGTHQYLIPNTILECDLFINVPKLKTHKKAGITAALKNLIGVQVDKDWLPHIRVGTPAQGGDETWEIARLDRFRNAVRDRLQGGPPWIFGLAYRVWRLLKQPMAQVGPRQVVAMRAPMINDTLWRTIADLNAIILGQVPGLVSGVHRRQYLCVVDAVVAGQGDGPLHPQPLPLGCIVVGRDPVVIDTLCCRLLGIDWRKIQTVAKVLALQRYRLTERTIDDLEDAKVALLDGAECRLGAIASAALPIPAPGWADAMTNSTL